jgi:hypothetical protein
MLLLTLSHIKYTSSIFKKKNTQKEENNNRIKSYFQENPGEIRQINYLFFFPPNIPFIFRAL